MKNITTIILGLIFIFCISNVSAQEKPARDKIESLKIAYFTEKLDLTEKESQAFWPIYNNYKKEKKAITGKKTHSGKPNFNEMSNEEINAFINDKIEREEQMLNLKKQYFEKYKLVLSLRKIALLISLEKDFRKEILNRINKRI